MTVQEVWAWLDRLAPFESQAKSDNSGLLLGDPNAEIHRVLFALDATLPTVREAVSLGADMIVCHHPLMFDAVRSIRYDQPEGAVLSAIIGAGIHLIAAHTNLDQATGGTSDLLARSLGLSDVAFASGNTYLRSGTLASPLTAGAFLEEINRSLGGCTRLYGSPDTLIRRVTVGSGAIGEEYAVAARDNADAFVVGEIKHHELIAAQALGLTVFDAGHYATEQPGLEALYQRFQSDARTSLWPVEAHLTAILPYTCHTA